MQQGVVLLLDHLVLLLDGLQVALHGGDLSEQHISHKHTRVLAGWPAGASVSPDLLPVLPSYLRPQFYHVRLHLIVGLIQIFDFFIQLLDFFIVFDA